MNYFKSLEYVYRVRYGDTDKLISKIGNKNFLKLLEKGYIIRGKSHPEVWKISFSGSELGIKIFDRSLFRKLLDKILFTLI